MSGGVAYIWDPKDAFPALLNREMVDIDPINDDDAAFLRHIVEAHVAQTGSAVGTALLADWPTAVYNFVKVMPQDYKRVLGVMKQAQIDGLDEEATNARVMASV